MNYIEEHGKKVAAVLCVASCFPVVAAVYAMETEPGWHGDRYINTDTTVATGWQEIEGKSYYFDESGSVDQKTTKKATVATVSSTVAEEVQTNVSQTTKEVVQEEVKAVEEQKAQEAVVESTVVEEAVVQEPVQVVEESTAAVSQPTYTEEVTEPVVETPAAEQTPVTETQPEEEQAPVTDTQLLTAILTLVSQVQLNSWSALQMECGVHKLFSKHWLWLVSVMRCSCGQMNIFTMVTIQIRLKLETLFIMTMVGVE